MEKEREISNTKKVARTLHFVKRRFSKVYIYRLLFTWAWLNILVVKIVLIQKATQWRRIDSLKCFIEGARKCSFSLCLESGKGWK